MLKECPKFHCLFEQSGTFKKEIIKMGYYAYDYDICNNFSCTDYVCDLFNEIQRAYYNKSSIFDRIDKNDYVLAFFPCTRFSGQFVMYLDGNTFNVRNKSDVDKVEMAFDLHEQVSEFYNYFCMLFVVAYRKGFKMVVENPYSGPHYLKRNFPIKPSIVITNRRDLGDYYVKPTQFWFVNFKPSCNVFFEPLMDYPPKSIDKERGFTRSEISPYFAYRFLRAHVMERGMVAEDYEFKEGWNNG